MTCEFERKLKLLLVKENYYQLNKCDSLNGSLRIYRIGIRRWGKKTIQEEWKLRCINLLRHKGGSAIEKERQRRTRIEDLTHQVENFELYSTTNRKLLKVPEQGKINLR